MSQTTRSPLAVAHAPSTEAQKLFAICRPAGWVESDEEDDGILEEHFQPLSLPEYSSTWIGNTCSFVHRSTLFALSAAWIVFESWASSFLGLDESKYEWAKYELQADMEEELENIATNSMPPRRVIQSMEEGRLKPATMHMSRTQ